MNFDVQKQKRYLVDFPNGEVPVLKFSFHGGMNRLVFRCKDLWYIEVPEECQSWVCVREEEGSAGTYQVQVEVNRYEGLRLRESTVLLCCWNERIRIPLMQYPEFVPVEDPVFEAYLLRHYEGNSVGKLSQETASRITEIDLGFGSPVVSLKGIEYMPNLKVIRCGGYPLTEPNRLTELDVRYNTALTVLECGYNRLTSIKFGYHPALTQLICGHNQLTSLDVRRMPKLFRLECGFNQLTELDVRQNLNLSSMICHRNALTALDLSQNRNLGYLECQWNQLVCLDLSQNLGLTTLMCTGNRLRALDVRLNSKLTYLDCCDNPLKTLEIGQQQKLEHFFID